MVLETSALERALLVLVAAKAGADKKVVPPQMLQLLDLLSWGLLVL